MRTTLHALPEHMLCALRRLMLFAWQAVRCTHCAAAHVTATTANHSAPCAMLDLFCCAMWNVECCECTAVYAVQCMECNVRACACAWCVHRVKSLKCKLRSTCSKGMKIFKTVVAKCCKHLRKHTRKKVLTASFVWRYLLQALEMMSICLSVCLSICMYVCMYACMYVCICVYIYMAVYIYMYIYIYVYTVCSTNLAAKFWPLAAPVQDPPFKAAVLQSTTYLKLHLKYPPLPCLFENLFLLGDMLNFGSCSEKHVILPKNFQHLATQHATTQTCNAQVSHITAYHQLHQSTTIRPRISWARLKLIWAALASCAKRSRSSTSNTKQDKILSGSCAFLCQLGKFHTN